MGELRPAIFVPGLGDADHTGIQKFGVNTWRMWRLEPHYFPMGWADGEPFEPKFDRLLAKIDELADGELRSVSLVGSSAGASVALNAFARRREVVHKVVTICGKIQNPETIEEWRFEQNPAFRGAIAMLSENLESLGANDRRRIMTMYPIADNVVSPADAVLEGANKKRIFMRGHTASIAAAVTLGGPAIAHFIKKP